MSEQIVNRELQMSKWELIERISKTLSIVAIPMVLAFGGWIIQQHLQNQTVSRDYVQLAVSILKEPKDSNQEMRSWAVELLNQNSPTKFTTKVIDQLNSGTTRLPESFNVTVVPTATASDNPQGTVSDWELKGFGFIVSKDAEAAIEAFANAEKLRPVYHNVAEIRKLLEENRAALVAAPREGPSEAWRNVYRTILSKYSWGMPDDVKKKLAE